MFTHDKLTEATQNFQKYVEPLLYSSGMFDPKNSYVIICEGDSDDLRSKMDKYAGIDMCTIDKGSQTVQGIASRVQKGSCYESFTIRAITDNGNFDTELKKRALAIKNGDMYPTWTIQSYLSQDDDKMEVTVGIIRTVDLFNFVMDQIHSEGFTKTSDLINALKCWSHIGELSIRQNAYGGSVFLVCDWSSLANNSVDFDVLKGSCDI